MNDFEGINIRRDFSDPRSVVVIHPFEKGAKQQFRQLLGKHGLSPRRMKSGSRDGVLEVELGHRSEAERLVSVAKESTEG